MGYLSREQINRILADSGSKNTRPRRAIAQALAACGKPCTAGEIYREINSYKREINSYKTEVNLSTVYRTLELFTKKGVTEKTVLNDGMARFQLKNTGHRHHLYCTACKKTVEIEACPVLALETEVTKATNFDIIGHKLELYGICPDCKAESECE